MNGMIIKRVTLHLVSITEPALTKFGSWWIQFALSSKAMIFKISGRRSTSGRWKAFRALILFFAANSIVFSYRAISCNGVWIVSSTPLSILIELFSRQRESRRSDGESSWSEMKCEVAIACRSMSELGEQDLLVRRSLTADYRRGTGMHSSSSSSIVVLSSYLNEREIVLGMSFVLPNWSNGLCSATIATFNLFVTDYRCQWLSSHAFPRVRKRVTSLPWRWDLELRLLSRRYSFRLAH